MFSYGKQLLRVCKLCQLSNLAKVGGCKGGGCVLCEFI